MGLHEIPARERQIRELISEVYDKTGIHLDYDDLLIAEYLMLSQHSREAGQQLEAAEKSFIERLLQHNEVYERRQRAQLAEFSASLQEVLRGLRLLVLSMAAVMVICCAAMALLAALIKGWL